ncbi:MAG: GNAT family N-acetyltransferase [Anaerolineae bacterium]
MDIRPLTHADLAQWSELLAAAFQRPQAEMCALLGWMLTGYRLTAYGAWDSDRLAAQYSCIYTSLYVPGGFQHTLAGMSVNMATHPDYRGRGLIKQVSQPVYETLAAEGVAAGVGFSNAEGVQVDRHSKGYGYRVVGRLVPYAALVPPRRQRTHTLQLSDTFCDHTQGFSWNRERICFSASACTVIQRFAHHPFRQYRFGIWEDSGQLCGVVVDRRVRGGVSLIAAHCTVEYSLRELLHRWLSSLEGERFVHLLASPNSSVRAALHAITPCIPLPYSRHPYYLTAKALQADTSPAFFDFARWDCIGGDIL